MDINGYDEYRTGQQPCDNFTTVREEWFGPVRHQCPRCYDLRMFCGNCFQDHHRNGWETCVCNIATGDENTHEKMV